MIGVAENLESVSLSLKAKLAELRWRGKFVLIVTRVLPLRKL